jgi:hypothetical protein
MTTARAVLAGSLCAGWLCCAAARAAEEPSIAIDSIQPDVRITGHVTGFSPEQLRDKKVVVYVLTDQWYVHPFADGGDGKSWAAIKDDGSWKIGTVKRDFTAKRIAAVVVPSAYDAPPRLQTLHALPARALTVRDLKGTPDFGKL